ADRDRSSIERWRIDPDGAGASIDPKIETEDGRSLDRFQTGSAAITAGEYSAGYPILQSPGKPLCIHAALWGRHGAGVAIAGPSFAGKSTLACALWTRGWSFLCDDVTMIAGGDAYATPRRVSLRRESRALLGDVLWDRVEQSSGFSETKEGCLFH